MNKYDNDIAAIENAQHHIGQAITALKGIANPDVDDFVEDLRGSLSMAESEADIAEGHAIDAHNTEDDRLMEEAFNAED